jgi:crotonobetainyl-CoA:carnitine CoA-transferase CaiB-like acyl-CoA transferase
MTSALLAGIRVLDLTNERAELAGRLLADLGAEVLKLEPPGGVSTRSLPPFDETGGDEDGTSLYWAAVGLGKLSAVLDITTTEGRERLKALARVADVLIESFDPGTLDQIELGQAALRRENPRLIFASVTPYGSGGPKASWPATELTLEAAGGRLALQGDPDRPPLPIGYPQAAFHAGAQMAADVIIALNERELSGEGQYLDASMQEAVLLTLMNYAGFPALTGGDPPGMGDDRGTATRGGAAGPGMTECADGYVLATNITPLSVARVLPGSILPRLEGHGEAPTTLAGLDWQSWLADAREGKSDASVTQAVNAAVRAFFKRMTKAQIMEWAWANDVILGPVNLTRDLLTNPHLLATGFWQKLGGRTYPGPAVRASRTPIVFDRPAPAIGQDQATIEEWLRTEPAPASTGATAPRLGEAFAGLKVADFSWVAVGPITAKALADHGATVVRIESSTRVDFVRTLTPFKDNVPGINRSHFMNNLNTSKLGVAINLATAEGRELARQITEWADVVVENFTPGTMKRLGLDYETLSKGRPELIMISTCLMGQKGPWASFAGYGPQGAAISGFRAITGWPDRAPVGPVGPYSDVIAPHYSVAALAAAILHRRKTGLGQHIDVSQVEAAIHFIEPLVLDEIVNGRTAGPAGHDSERACPHGVYPTGGTERYIAIAVETAAQWQALKRLAPLAAFDDARFDSLAERLKVRDEIDVALQSWTASQDRRELEASLAAAGVPAAVAMRPSELHEDPNLAARGFFVPLEHSECGTVPYDGFMTRFSAKQTMLHKAAPCVGEDNEYVLRSLLGLTDDAVADYALADVLL